MNQIKPYAIWIGHAGDGGDFEEILDNGIRAIVQVAAEEVPLQPPRELTLLRFPLLDGPDNDPDLLYLAIMCVQILIRNAIPTLVCCNAGMSRSPAIVAAALALELHALLDDSLVSVSKSHTTDISTGFLGDVVRALKGRGG
jgi:hypothetical protein